MPRRKKIVDSEGEATQGSPAVQPIRPDGVSEETWTEASKLSESIGNISLSLALVEVSGGLRAPKDSSEISALVKASNGVQQKAITRYLRFRDSIGNKLRSMYDEYTVSKDRTDRLAGLFENPRVLVAEHERTGGNARADVLAGQPVSSADSEPVSGGVVPVRDTD